MASPVRCFLEVGGRVYLDGICNYESLGGGSFSIGTGDPPSKYFAYVEIDTSAGVARGYWNGTAGASHAHEDLGSLPYWVNDRAKVYASR